MGSGFILPMKRRQRKRTPALERLEDRLPLTLPLGALPSDTGEFMLGDVYVNVVAMESDGTIDPSTEDWTPSDLAAVKQKVQDGVNWWNDLLAAEFPNVPSSVLNFQFDFTYFDNPVATPYEPIALESQQFTDWMPSFFNAAIPGGSTGNTPNDIFNDIKTFNHQQRVAHDADFSYTIFVINDKNDNDHSFKTGGQLPGAFSYAGGQFAVIPSDRAPKSYAHESGHQFWAQDEYAGGASYNDFRGYYNTPNHNALQDAPLGFVQETSIMANSWTDAFNTHTTDAYSLAAIGWQDTDSDGIFDVLDVDHTLEGVGYINPTTGDYRFLGSSHVNTLPNLNPAGNQSDITINEIREVQYRIDGGAWQAIDVPDAYSVDLDLTIPAASLPPGFSTIELRTYDTRTHVASPIFTGGPSAPSSIGPAGISGFVRRDANNDGVLQANELGLGGWTVTLTNGTNPVSFYSGNVEPDDYAPGTEIPPDTGVVLSAVNAPGGLPTIFASSGNPASTGSNVFRYLVSNSGGTNVLSQSFSRDIQLKITFFEPTSVVQIDAIGNGVISGVGDFGRLEIYDLQHNLLGRYTTKQLASGDVETMTLADPQGRIAYAIARGHTDTGVQLDNLHWGPSNTATTDQYGAFSLPYVPGLFAFYDVTPPPGGALTIDNNPPGALYVAGQSLTGVTFGGITSVGQNPVNRFDVNDDTFVTVADVIALITDYRAHGGNYPVPEPPGGIPQPPFSDVNGDGEVTIADLIELIGSLRNVPASEPSGGGSSLSSGDGLFNGGAVDDGGSATSGGSGGGGLGGTAQAEPSVTASSTPAAFGSSIFPLAGTGRSQPGDALSLPLIVSLRAHEPLRTEATGLLHSEFAVAGRSLSGDGAEDSLTIGVLPEFSSAALTPLDWRAVDRLLAQTLRQTSSSDRRHAPAESADAAEHDDASPQSDRSPEAHDEVFGELERYRRDLEKRRQFDPDDEQPPASPDGEQPEPEAGDSEEQVA